MIFKIYIYKYINFINIKIIIMAFNGNIIMYTGPMFGGKSTRLMAEYDRFSRVNKKCLLIRYSLDDRYENTITHNNNYGIKEGKYGKELISGIKYNEVKCKCLYEIDNIIKDYEIIFIDEIQFFEDCDIYCEKWANENKIIRLSGLITTSDRKLFTNIENLIPLIERIEYCSAVCTDNNKENVYFTDRINNENNDEIVIGTNDIYKPVDREIWFKNKNNYLTMYVRLMKRFNIIYNKHNNTNYILDEDKLTNYLDENYPRTIIFKDCLILCSKGIL